MSISDMILPFMIISMMVIWLCIGKQFIERKPNLGFWFLTVYILVLTHCCLSQIEDSKYTPDSNFGSAQFFKRNENKNYQFTIIECRGKEFIRVRPWSENYFVFLGYHLYRLFLFHSGLPEFLLDFKGNLVDWTTDSDDDPRYQGLWGKSKKMRTISMSEYLEEIDNKT